MRSTSVGQPETPEARQHRDYVSSSGSSSALRCLRTPGCDAGGNPGGRPRSEKEIHAAIQKRGLEMVEALFAIAFNEKEETSDRIRAFHELWNRGYGKPPESIKIAGGVTVEQRKRVILEDDKPSPAPAPAPGLRIVAS